MEDHDVRIARGAIVATALVTPFAGVAGWFIAGGPGAVGALIGTLLAAAFFGVTVVAVHFAGRISPELMLPATLGSYLVKMAALGTGLYLLRDTTAFDHQTFALAVLLGTVVFLAAEVRLALRSRTPYLSTPRDNDR